ncbi:MAG: hypothetical protein N2316_09080 [Spirochaetes bacterium]|nr:hypothetical protein [Spirochaetota bacterium]
MDFKTTYMMTEEVLCRVNDAAKKTGRDAMELILHAMRLLVNDCRNLRHQLGPVEYQKRLDDQTGEKIVKRRVKVKMDRRENMLFQDMRRFYFMSISLLIAIAVRRYLDRVVAYYLAEFYEEREDSYPSGNWMYKEKCTETAIAMTVWYGVPPNFWEEFFN